MSGQLSYPYSPPLYLEGQRAAAGTGNYSAESFVNPLLQQISTLTVAGTATDGVYSVTFAQTNDPSFVPVTISTTRAGGAPATNALIATALSVAINASNPMLGIAASVDGGAGVLTLTGKTSGLAWTLTTAAPAPGTLVGALTQSPAGAVVRVGAWGRHTAAASAADVLVPFTTAATIAEMMGCVERTFGLVNDPTSAFDYYRAGSRPSLVRSGIMAMKVWETVTEFSTPSIWIDPADATAFPGQMGTTVTGGKSIDASTKCRYRTRTSAGSIALVEIFFGA